MNTRQWRKLTNDRKENDEKWSFSELGAWLSHNSKQNVHMLISHNGLNENEFLYFFGSNRSNARVFLGRYQEPLKVLVQLYLLTNDSKKEIVKKHN